MNSTVDINDEIKTFALCAELAEQVLHIWEGLKYPNWWNMRVYANQINMTEEELKNSPRTGINLLKKYCLGEVSKEKLLPIEEAIFLAAYVFKCDKEGIVWEQQKKCITHFGLYANEAAPYYAASAAGYAMRGLVKETKKEALSAVDRYAPNNFMPFYELQKNTINKYGIAI